MAELIADDKTLLLDLLKRLDRLSQLGAGRMPVVPMEAITDVGQGRFEGVSYVAWPSAAYEAVRNAWERLGLFGREAPFGTNARITAALKAAPGTYGSTYAVGLLRLGVTVDGARQALRQDLQTAGLLPASTSSSSSVPWGWILGTGALGIGLGFTLYFADQHAKKRELMGPKSILRTGSYKEGK